MRAPQFLNPSLKKRMASVMDASLEKAVAATEGVREAGAISILLTTTSRWPSSARLMIEFSRVGHVVSIVCPAHAHPSRKVRVAHRTFPYKPLAPLNSLANAIEAAKPDLIIPCDDLAVRHLHQLHSSKRARHGRSRYSRSHCTFARARGELCCSQFPLFVAQDRARRKDPYA